MTNRKQTNIPNSEAQGQKALRVIISGGGTGGHIFPAISIANAIRELRPEAEIRFVGAEGRMEMQRVPQAGYEIVGLPIEGLDRKRLWRNVSVAGKLLKALWKARAVIRQFRPQVAVGVGGYASGPTLQVASWMGIPTLLQEQNSYAGVTNRLLARRAARICVAYEGMERFFPADKICLTGNPVRQSLSACPDRAAAAAHFGLNPQKRTILILGGSLGARTLNQTLTAALSKWKELGGVQVIWQTGRIYIEQVKQAIAQATGQNVDGQGHVEALPGLYVADFLPQMEMAYAAADLVVSRAGAGSISEFCLLGKAVLLVPSPNVSEDHQTKNALALVGKGAALMVTDADARETLLPTALKAVADDQLLGQLREQIAMLAQPQSAERIAHEVIRLAEQAS